jgi:predicted component of type VI protein secretion system
MVTLRLFHQTNPFKQIDSREICEGDLAIGREPGDGWTIDDPERELSRLHCVVEHRHDRLSLRDLSANGTFVGTRRARPAAGEPVPLEAGETFRLGRFLVVVENGAAKPAGEDASPAFPDPFSQPLLRPVEIGEEALAVPTDWSQPAEAPPSAAAPLSARQLSLAAGEGALLEAFCDGARLDASAFSGEEPAEVMRRLGAVYQQMILGLADLMSERTSVKTEYRLERTTIHAEGNNPFRWAPAQRVAVDLLRPRTDGFLSGPSAVKVSFEDLKKHLVCMAAGLRAALGAALDGLSPETVENQIAGRSFLANRSGAAWQEYTRLYAEFRQRAGDDPDSPLNREFRAGYGRRLQELDAMSTRS